MQPSLLSPGSSRAGSRQRSSQSRRSRPATLPGGAGQRAAQRKADAHRRGPHATTRGPHASGRTRCSRALYRPGLAPRGSPAHHTCRTWRGKERPRAHGCLSEQESRVCRPPSCREALPSLGRPHWGRPVRLPLQRHVCDQPVPLQRRRSQRQLLCLSHGGVCSCASQFATSSDGQRRARDKRARVPTGFAARKKKTRIMASASLGLTRVLTRVITTLVARRRSTSGRKTHLSCPQIDS